MDDFLRVLLLQEYNTRLVVIGLLTRATPSFLELVPDGGISIDPP